MKNFAWSYSALTRFENCPKQYWHMNVQKDFKDEDSEMAAEGKFIHDALKKRVISNTPLPLPLRHMEAMAARFANAAGEKHGEIRLALNRDFEPVDYFAKDVYMRVVIDLLIVQGTTGVLVDWKTGKPKDDPTQLGMSAGVLSRCMPELQLFKTAYVWTKHKSLTPKSYTLSKFPELWDSLLRRVGKMEDAVKTTDFPAKPSGLCRYCPVTSCVHHSRAE